MQLSFRHIGLKNRPRDNVDDNAKFLDKKCKIAIFGKILIINENF